MKIPMALIALLVGAVTGDEAEKGGAHSLRGQEDSAFMTNVCIKRIELVPLGYRI